MRPSSRALRRGTALLVLGVTLLSACVAFFVTYAVRDHALLRDGARAPGTVVRTIDPEPALLDEGRLVVRYRTPEGVRVEQIWLDDRVRTQAPGTRVTVVFDQADPSRVRTLRDPNDPMPWFLPMVLTGLVGVPFLVTGVRGVLHALDDRRYRRRHPGAVVPILAGAPLPETLPTRPAQDEPAWNDSFTTDRWSTYVRRTLLLGLGAVVLSGLATFLLVDETGKDRDLLTSGRPVPGVVGGGDYGGRHSQDHVDVRYAVAGRPVTGTLHGPSPDELARGTKVTVLYDPDDPHRFRTKEYANHDNATDNGEILLPMAAGVLVIGVAAALVRALRWRRWLRRGPWRVWKVVRVGEVGFSSNGLPVALLRGRTAEGGQVEMMVRFGGGWRAPKFVEDHKGSEVLVRDGTSRAAVLTAQSVERPYTVVRPVSWRQARRWRAATGPEPH